MIGTWLPAGKNAFLFHIIFVNDIRQLGNGINDVCMASVPIMDTIDGWPLPWTHKIN
jgi:hypothetical protein